MSRKRFAEGTTVSVERTQAEMRSLLAYHEAEAFGLVSDRQGDGLTFVLHGDRYQFTVKRPSPDEVRKFFPPASRLTAQMKVEREWMRLWRARLLWLRSTLEFAASEGNGEFRKALASALVMDDGRTLGAALDDDDVPLLLGGGTIADAYHRSAKP